MITMLLWLLLLLEFRSKFFTESISINCFAYGDIASQKNIHMINNLQCNKM